MAPEDKGSSGTSKDEVAPGEVVTQHPAQTFLLLLHKFTTVNVHFDADVPDAVLPDGRSQISTSAAWESGPLFRSVGGSSKPTFRGALWRCSPSTAMETGVTCSTAAHGFPSTTKLLPEPMVRLATVKSRAFCRLTATTSITSACPSPRPPIRTGCARSVLRRPPPRWSSFSSVGTARASGG